ncbi:carbohydrate ABC transporter permease [Limnochorda pilosa]|uniref:carbohydrate ABC transporter permease n=1 Tax=Limnochorda pilosa TaxID=1555112 RepID=UPI00130E5761|nr:carbohydrate ABC transporter permease [Limnochorda pilosa]
MGRRRPPGRQVAGRAGLYLVLGLVALSTLFPFLLMLSTSVRTGGALVNQLGDLIPETITFQNYRDVWVADRFDRYFLNSALVTVVVLAANLLFDSMVAYALSRKPFRGSGLVLALILARMMIPVHVLMIPIYVLIQRIGLYDTLAALMLPSLVEGFGIFLMKQYFDGLPRSLDEAARVDGAGDFQILFRVLMPLARPALAVVLINTALTTWNQFLMPLILTSSAETRTLTLGLALYQGRFGVDYVHQMAAAAISALPIVALFLVFQRQIIAGLTRGAVKQ